MVRIVRGGFHEALRRHRAKDGGFTLIEVLIGITLLGLAVFYMGGAVIGAGNGTQRAQARAEAIDLANAALQEGQNLGYDTVAEGVDCPTSTSACASDPNGLYHYSGGSSGCWYYGTGTSTRYLVPVIAEASSGSSDAPLIPFSSTQTVDHVSYTTSAYPMFDTSAYSGVSCATLANDSAPEVPIILVVVVSWGSGGLHQTVSEQTQLFETASIPPVAGACPIATALNGGHVESHLANPSNSTGANPPGGAAGNPVSIWFFDEAPTSYSPSFCLTLSDGSTVPYSILVNQTPFGTSSANPFVTGSGMAVSGTNSGTSYSSAACTGGTANLACAVHPSFAGSSPNAAKPPTAGTYCTSPCAVEILWTIPTPSTYNGLTVECLTIAGWDHEGDFDTNTWSFNATFACPAN